VAHWAWTPGGWLYDLGYLDFAGSSVVHLLGGSCAFVGAWACGPRVGRFGEAGDGGSEASKPYYMDRRGSEHQSEASFKGFDDVPFRHKLVEKLFCGWGRMYRFVDIITLNGTPGFRVRDQAGHSAPMQCLGALLLYVAWFSFNAGSSGGVDTIPKANSAARAAVNTMLTAASATVTALLWSDFFVKQYDLNLVINSLLGGMVAITAGCGYIDCYAAIALGVVTIPVYVACSKFVLYGLHVE
jgi:ammonia channel protein AmtB